MPTSGGQVRIEKGDVLRQTSSGKMVKVVSVHKNEENKTFFVVDLGMNSMGMFPSEDFSILTS
jgi:hypothetical protein